MRLTIAFFALSTVFASCNKDKTDSITPCEPEITLNHSNDTIFPSDYLMTYPGSWWEYDTGLIDSCGSWKAVPIRTKTIINGCTFVNEDMWILPVSSIFGYGRAFDKQIYNIYSDTNSTTLIPIYDTIVGVFHDETTYDGNTKNLTGETLERLDSMTIGSNTYYDVLHVKRILEIYDYGNGGAIYTDEKWFAKNTGVIKWINGISGAINYDVELVNHYIAPH